MLIIGSRALSYWFSDEQIGRVPKDWDLICTRSEMEQKTDRLGINLKQSSLAKYNGKALNGDFYEFELVEECESAARYQALFNYGQTHGYYASAPILFSIKSSHINYPRFWSKHIRDYHLLKSKVKEDRYPEITKIRKAETELRIGKLKTPSLNKSKDDFFDDNVSNRTFIHDNIHMIMAHREKPMYEYIKIDPNKVACSHDKFLGLVCPDQIVCVLEEAYVIALERRIIPMLYEGKKYTIAKDAFDWALMRICTTLCSGWFRQFAVDNWPDIQKSYDPNYVNKFLRAVEAKQITKINKEIM